MGRAWLAVCFLAAALTLGACSSDGSTSGSTADTLPRYLGDHPGQEATSLHLAAGDCARLAAVVEKQAERPLRRQVEPTPPNSRCQLQGRGVHVSISLDASNAARQRYSNRIAEQVQFNAADPDKLPQPVPGVGDKAAYNHYASWIPAFSTLWAVRGNRWLTVVYSLAGRTRPQRLTEAADLARLAFKLSTR